jgi:hypothetical protein
MPGEEMDVARREQDIPTREDFTRRSLRKRRVAMMHRRSKEAARGRQQKRKRER